MGLAHYVKIEVGALAMGKYDYYQDPAIEAAGRIFRITKVK
jgi:hypothetical protein